MIGILLLPIALLIVIQVVMVLTRPGKPRVGRSEKHGIVVRRLNQTGLAVLGAGLIASGIVFYSSPPDAATDPDLQVDTLAMSHKTSKKAEAEMEKVGGKAEVQISDFLDWLGSLWHGRALSATLAVLSGFIAVIFFLIARGLH